MHRVGIGIVAFGLGILGTWPVVGTAGGTATGCRRRPDERVTLLVPAYFYPSGARRDDWTRLAEAARTVPLEVILNPASGPGRRQDPRYVEVLGPLRKSGARVLAYVDSDYARRPLSAVEDDLRAYTRFYAIDGYFIDQMANGPRSVEYYRSIREAVRRIDPRLKVVGNPGTSTLPEYLETADALVTFEGPARAFADHDPRSSSPWMAGRPPGRFAAIVYDARTPASACEVLARASRAGFGSIYVTDQEMPNPYLGLPAHWPQRVAEVRAINERASSPLPPCDRAEETPARPR